MHKTIRSLIIKYNDSNLRTHTMAYDGSPQMLNPQVLLCLRPLNPRSNRKVVCHHVSRKSHGSLTTYHRVHVTITQSTWVVRNQCTGCYSPTRQRAMLSTAAERTSFPDRSSAMILCNYSPQLFRKGPFQWTLFVAAVSCTILPQ